MSRVLQDVYSHDFITRMLAQDEIEQSLYWKLIKPTIKQVKSSEGVISIDDTIETSLIVKIMSFLDGILTIRLVNL